MRIKRRREYVVTLCSVRTQNICQNPSADPVAIARIFTHQSADLFLSVRGGACGRFDHGGRLVVCQFFDTALSSYDVTDLHCKRAYKKNEDFFFFEMMFKV